MTMAATTTTAMTTTGAQDADASLAPGMFLFSFSYIQLTIIYK